VAQDLAARGISLPSYPTLSAEELARVCEALVEAL
jgi:perosamine synthetase